MIINTDAIVLHRMKYKNTSLIARLFTKEEGKISVIVNNAARQKGNMFGVIEPPNIIQLIYFQRKTGSLQICNEASFLSNNLSMKSDMLKLSVGLSIVEIIDKTVQDNDVNLNIYNLADKTLNILNNTEINPQLILAFFLLNITRDLGFMPALQSQENVQLNQTMKMNIHKLAQCEIDDLATIKTVNINFLNIITFFENYIREHLKLNKKIQSLNMIRELIHG